MAAAQDVDGLAPRILRITTLSRGRLPAAGRDEGTPSSLPRTCERRCALMETAGESGTRLAVG